MWRCFGRGRDLRAGSLSFLICFWPAFASAQDPLRATVRIYSTYSGSALPVIGSGAFTSASGEVLTAYHVVQGATKVEVCNQVEPCTPAILIAYNETNDLAKLKIQPRNPVSDFFNQAPSPVGLLAKEAEAYGNPGGKGNSGVPVRFFRDAIFQAEQYPDPKTGGNLFSNPKAQLLGTIANFNPGMSGGPVVLNRLLIGVVSGTEGDSGTNLGWAIPATTPLTPAPPGMTFATAPPLNFLTDRARKPLLKSSLTPQRQEDLTRLHETLQKLKSDMAALQAEAPGLRSRFGALPVSTSDNDPQAQTRLKLLADVLKYLLGGLNNLRAWIRVNGQLFNQAGAELQRAVEAMNSVNSFYDTLAPAIQALNNDFKRKDLTQDDLLALRARAAKIQAQAAKGTAAVNYLVAERSNLVASIDRSQKASIDAIGDAGAVASAVEGTSATADQVSALMKLPDLERRRADVEKVLLRSLDSAGSLTVVLARLTRVAEDLDKPIEAFIAFYLAPPIVELRAE